MSKLFSFHSELPPPRPINFKLKCCHHQLNLRELGYFEFFLQLYGVPVGINTFKSMISLVKTDFKLVTGLCKFRKY